MLPAKIDFAPVLEVPNDAPPLKVDVNNPHLSMEDVLPENFFSMESLQNWLDARSADARVLTVSGVSMEILFDPAKEKASDGEWRPVLWFAETETGLVINKTRARQLGKLAGPLLSQWRTAGQVAIKPGIANGKAQIIIQSVPGGQTRAQRPAAEEDPEPEWAKQAPTGKTSGNGRRTVDQVNEELFG